MPNRILREGILTSPRIARLGWAEEVFYRRLHSVVDDFGRYFADVGLLRAACYPRQLNKVTDPDIGKWLAACEAAALVRVYPAEDGERYLQVLDFGQQVRAKRSKFPDPPSTCAADATQTLGKGAADAPVFVSVSVDEKRATRLPATWVLPPEWAEWARDERPDLEPEAIACQFRDYWIARPGKDGRKTDWLATWRNWVRNQRAAVVPLKRNDPFAGAA